MHDTSPQNRVAAQDARDGQERRIVLERVMTLMKAAGMPAEMSLHDGLAAGYLSVEAIDAAMRVTEAELDAASTDEVGVYLEARSGRAKIEQSLLEVVSAPARAEEQETQRANDDGWNHWLPHPPGSE